MSGRRYLCGKEKVKLNDPLKWHELRVKANNDPLLTFCYAALFLELQRYQIDLDFWTLLNTTHYPGSLFPTYDTNGIQRMEYFHVILQPEQAAQIISLINPTVSDDKHTQKFLHILNLEDSTKLYPTDARVPSSWDIKDLKDPCYKLADGVPAYSTLYASQNNTLSTKHIILLNAELGEIFNLHEEDIAFLSIKPQRLVLYYVIALLKTKVKIRLDELDLKVIEVLNNLSTAITDIESEIEYWHAEYDFLDEQDWEDIESKKQQHPTLDIYMAVELKLLQRKQQFSQFIIRRIVLRCIHNLLRNKPSEYEPLKTVPNDLCHHVTVSGPVASGKSTSIAMAYSMVEEDGAVIISSDEYNKILSDNMGLELFSKHRSQMTLAEAWQIKKIIWDEITTKKQSGHGYHWIFETMNPPADNQRNVIYLHTADHQRAIEREQRRAQEQERTVAAAAVVSSYRHPFNNLLNTINQQNNATTLLSLIDSDLLHSPAFQMLEPNLKYAKSTIAKLRNSRLHIYDIEKFIEFMERSYRIPQHPNQNHLLIGEDEIQLHEFFNQLIHNAQNIPVLLHTNIYIDEQPLTVAVLVRISKFIKLKNKLFQSQTDQELYSALNAIYQFKNTPSLTHLEHSLIDMILDKFKEVSSIKHLNIIGFHYYLKYYDSLEDRIRATQWFQAASAKIRDNGIIVTTMLEAAQHGDLAFIKQQINASNNARNLQNTQGETAVHIAVKNLDPCAVFLLVMPFYCSGINIFIKNHEGDTAFDLAKKIREHQQLHRDQQNDLGKIITILSNAEYNFNINLASYVSCIFNPINLLVKLMDDLVIPIAREEAFIRNNPLLAEAIQRAPDIIGLCTAPQITIIGYLVEFALNGAAEVGLENPSLRTGVHLTILLLASIKFHGTSNHSTDLPSTDMAFKLPQLSLLEGATDSNILATVGSLDIEVGQLYRIGPALTAGPSIFHHSIASPSISSLATGRLLTA